MSVRKGALRVLIIHTNYKYQGGEDTVVKEEMKLLLSQGIDVELLLFNNDNNTLLNILQLPFNINSYLKTRSKLAQFKPDIVHIHNLHFAASPSVIWAIRKSKIPFVITVHNYRLVCPSAILFHRGKLFLNSITQAFPWTAIVKGVYKNSRILTFWVSACNYLHRVLGTWQLCDRYILLSEHAKKIILQSTLNIAADKLTIKPNFCEAPALVTSVDKGYFLFIGRLTEEKGVRMLLDVFSSTTHRIKIAGDGPMLNEVKGYSENFSNIEFLGSLKKEKVFELLANCSALIFPSTWYEGMPLTIIEAFASGAPVIASKLGAMESMVSHHYNGLHFEATSSEDLRNKIEEWCSLTTQEKMVYRNNARKSYEQNYTPGKNAEELVAIYESVIREKRDLLVINKKLKVGVPEKVLSA